jgi:hypothetical protein
MLAVYPNEGLKFLYDSFLTGAATLRVRLYVNNYTPVPGSVYLNFTEASWGGYANVPITSGDLSFNGIVGNRAVFLFDPVAFLNSSGSPVTTYGYYVSDSSGTTVFQAALFDTARVIPNGDSTSVIVALSDFSENI